MSILNPSIFNNSFSLVQDLISALSILPNTAFKFEAFDNLSITSKSVKGGFNVIIPNYNYSDKSLRLNLSRANNDFLSTAGYENTITNFTIGTGFEYKQDLFFTPLIVMEAEKLTTDSTAYGM